MAKKRKETFVFRISWQEVLKDYPAEVRLEVYDAMIEYVASGTLPKLKPLANMAFSFIKRDIDADDTRYTETVAKRAEAGRKGMKERWSRQDNNDNTCYQSYQEVTNVTTVTNITDNDYVYDNDLKEENKKKKKGSSTVERIAVGVPTALEEAPIESKRPNNEKAAKMDARFLRRRAGLRFARRRFELADLLEPPDR